MIEVPLADEVTAGDAFSAGSEGYVVGDPPVWKDNSTATYASFAGQYAGPDNPQFSGAAGAAVDPATTALPKGELVIVRLQLNTVAGSAVKLPGVRLSRSSTVRFSVTPADTDLAPTAATWVDYQMVEESAGVLDTFRVEPWTFKLDVLAPIYTVTVPNEIQRWNVYEARVYLYAARNVAPPARLFPREDGLGVGGGRVYPPPKSQQRSRRQFGYY